MPKPLRPLASGEVPRFNKAFERALDTANRNLDTVLPLKLGSKVLGGNTGPRATVRVQLTALLVLTEDDSDPPENTG